MEWERDGGMKLLGNCRALANANVYKFISSDPFRLRWITFLTSGLSDLRQIHITRPGVAQLGQNILQVAANAIMPPSRAVISSGTLNAKIRSGAEDGAEIDTDRGR